MKELTIVKIGGNIIDDEAGIENALNYFNRINGAKIMVHGGGSIASQILDRMGIKPHMINGRRITNAETMRVVQMVYGGLLNKDLVARLQKLGCNALGISGADGNTILAHKRPVKEIDYGFAGDIDRVAGHKIVKLLSAGFTPVFCPLTHDGSGQLLNTNADTMATELAIALSAYYRIRLVYIFDKPGVLSDIDDKNSLIRHLNREGFSQLQSTKQIQDGMIPKLDNVFQALESGVGEVFICDGRNPGTRVTLN